MPLFQRRFSVPKFPNRKASSMVNLPHLDGANGSREFGLDFGPIKTRLSGRDLVFHDGNWTIENDTTLNSSQADREAQKVKKENYQLTEENNLLKLKIDILLDMLAETTAEVHLQENEIENLRSMLSKKPTANMIQVS